MQRLSSFLGTFLLVALFHVSATTTCALEENAGEDSSLLQVSARPAGRDIPSVLAHQARENVSGDDSTGAASTAYPYVWTQCIPCEIRYPDHNGHKDLQIDIWNAKMRPWKTPRPVVLAYHGSGGNVKTMKPHCTKVFNVAGFLCASVAPRGTTDNPSQWTEDTIKFLIDNRYAYNVDTDKFFLYGYSAGGMSALRYMVHTFDWYTRDRVLGMISDASADGRKEYDFERKVDGEYVRYPPYLMMHCAADPKMRPNWTVKQSIRKIDRANSKRDSRNQILYHWLKYTRASGCTHDSLLLNSATGSASATQFIENIVRDFDSRNSTSQSDPFSGIPDEVNEPNV